MLFTQPPTSRVDVSHLRHAALDHQSQIWWGNLWLIFIETTMFVILVASYFYIRLNYEQWPPPQTLRLPVVWNTSPALLWPTLNLVLLLVSLVPARIIDLATLRMDSRTTERGMIAFLLFSVASIVLRFFEFTSLYFRWDENAYASVTWSILGMHLLHLFVGTLEFVVMAAWVYVKGMDDKHARDIRVTALYWYWVVGIWVLLYAIVYLSPRVI